VAFQSRRERSQEKALIFGLAGIGLVVLLALAGAAVRRGRSRGWTPAGTGADPQP
jgi:hypothetical protein